MTKIAKLFTTGGSQAVRLPKEFRFPGTTVRLRRTKHGVLITPASEDVEERRRRLMKLAGSCPNFPLREPPPGEDVPRDLSW